jgi:hypothetical protein
MINLRETEIRNESLEIVVETYRVANLITDSSKQSLRTKLVDAAFMVSASIAKAFIALQNDQFEADIAHALKEIDSLLESLHKIEAESLLDVEECQPLRIILGSEQQELWQLLAASQTNNSFTLSPKLEKACI